MSDLISRADAMGAVQDHFNDDGFKGYDDGQKMLDRIKALPSADITEINGVITIGKESAKTVGEIKHIVVCSPNYTRYFYNDSMPTQYKGGEDE